MMTFDEWVAAGLMPRAHKPWTSGKVSKKIEIKQRPDGMWLAIAGRLHLCRGQKDEATTRALIAKLSC